MKSKISIALLALLAVAFLAVAPAAADLTIVPTGGVVFVGEQDLTFTTNAAATTLEWFGSDDPATASPSATYTLQGPGNEVIDPATFQTRLGNWYENRTPSTPGVAGAVAINVQMPSIEVKVFNAKNGEDMTDGRVVKDGTYMAFRVDSNLYQVLSPASTSSYRAPLSGQNTDIKVVVVDEGGATYTALYNNASGVLPVTTTALTNLTPTTSLSYLTGVTVAPGDSLSSNWYLDRTDYKAGVYTIYAQVDLNSLKDNLGTITGATKSTVRTLELGKDEVKIESSKDTVVRNNDFAVTITGRPNEYYVLWVKGTSSMAAGDTAPIIKANQNGVYYDYDLADQPQAANAGNYEFRSGNPVWGDVCPNSPDNGIMDCYAMVKLASSGSRTVGFSTSETTKDQTYTLRADFYPANAEVAQLPTTVQASGTYDTVKVKVEKGDITVTASGDSSYYIGEEVVLSGTNTDSDTTWLFITGPNLPANGGSLDTTLDPSNGVNSADAANPLYGAWYPDGYVTGVLPVARWTGEGVETDDTWEYKWDTAGVNLDAGTYTIYALTTATDKSGLSDATYATVSVVIKKPFVTATTSSTTVAKGDDLVITGNAEGNPTLGINFWTLGKNTYLPGQETVEDNGAFEYKLGTTNLAAGQYFVIVQHPMYNDLFDIETSTIGGQTFVYRSQLDPLMLNPLFIIDGTNSLQGSDAATALVNAMDSPDIDDTYYKLTFMVEEPWVMIDAVGDKYVGETFSITGTTNLAVGDKLIVETTSSSFKPTDKTQSGAFSGASGTVLVAAGETEGQNVWEFAVDASAFNPDEYIVTVEAVEADVTATQTFNVLKAEPTAEPTETPVETPVETATPVPTAEPTPEETATPGFGVLVALIGLGAVAALIVRKD